jgi:hypothetical protein
MAATSRRIASLRASIVRDLLLYTQPFSKSYRKKSGGVKSGDLGGHIFLEINLSPKKLSFSLMLALDVWRLAPSC